MIQEGTPNSVPFERLSLFFGPFGAEVLLRRGSSYYYAPDVG